MHQQKTRSKKKGWQAAIPLKGSLADFLLTELACITPNHVWLTAQEVLQELTHGKSPVELQVSSEEAPQARQHFPTGSTPIDLIAAVHQPIGRAAKVSFVQDSTQ